MAPPAKLSVTSLRGGVASADVRTSVGTPVLTNVVVTNLDSVTMFEDCSATAATSCATPPTFDVLANDTLNGAPVVSADVTVAISAPPVHGTALVVVNQIVYTPAANYNGPDLVGYTVTCNTVACAGSISQEGFLQITVTPVNDAPTAVNDTAGAVAGVATAINVLANDTDPDGAADLATAVIVTPPVGATAIVGAGGVVTFTAATAGTYTFTYRAQDKALALSLNTATVTVTVTGTEVLTVTRSEYTQAQRRWRVIGTSSVRAGQTITISYANGTMRNAQLVNGVLTTNAAGYVIGTAVVDALGNWTMDFIAPTAIGITNPTNTGNNTPTGSFWTSPPRNLRETSSLTGATTTSNLTIR